MNAMAWKAIRKEQAMSRNLRTLGLALMAALAVSAMGASGAIAQQGLATSDGPFFKVGTELPTGNSFTFPGLAASSCKESHFRGGIVGSTPHKPLSSGYSQFTVSPTYTNCKTGIFPMTVKMTTCDFRGQLGETTGGGDTYALTLSVECSTVGDVVHMEIYSNAAHTNLICSVTFGAQTPAGQALHASDTTNGKIHVQGKLTGLHGIRTNTGGCAPSSTTTEAAYEFNLEGTGENEEGGTTGVALSHK
jgi:hypothetical protein